MRDKDAAAILVLKQWLARDRGLRIWHASDEARAGVEAAIRLLEAAGRVTEGDAIGAECGVITEDALALIKAALPEVEEEPKHYRCEGCGRTFDEKLFSHGRAVDDGKGNPVEVECGPILEVGP